VVRDSLQEMFDNSRERPDPGAKSRSPLIAARTRLPAHRCYASRVPEDRIAGFDRDGATRVTDSEAARPNRLIGRAVAPLPHHVLELAEGSVQFRFGPRQPDVGRLVGIRQPKQRGVAHESRSLASCSGFRDKGSGGRRPPSGRGRRGDLHFTRVRVLSELGHPQLGLLDPVALHRSEMTPSSRSISQ
jgi:hypothetical protein